MRMLQVALLSTCVVAAATGPSMATEAGDVVEKKCILAAAEQLPGVPGLVITSSSAEKQTAGVGMLVTIGFDAAKQSYTASFDCLISGPGATAKMRGLPE